MRRTWTIIGVSDVAGSFRWYQSLLGLPATSPAHNYFGQILDSDGTVLLCLHERGPHDHPSLMSPDHAQPGNGLLLFFRVDDFDMALPRARTLVARLGPPGMANPYNVPAAAEILRTYAVLFDGPQNELQSLADVLREVQNGPPSLTICRKLAPSSNSFGFGLSFCRES